MKNIKLCDVRKQITLCEKKIKLNIVEEKVIKVLQVRHKNREGKRLYCIKRNSRNQSYEQDHKYIVLKSKWINVRRVP